MSSQFKKNVSLIGMVVGIIIIIIGFCLQNTSTYAIGESITFGADFYTEMYAVTKDASHAINLAINDLICAVSWLIIAIGAISICFFAHAFAKAWEATNYFNIKNIDKNVQIMAGPMIREAEEAAKRKAEGCDAQERAKCEAEEKVQRQTNEKGISKALAKKLEYALQYGTDAGMISYLKDIDDESVQSILQAPAADIRNHIKDLLEQLQ